MTSHNTHCYCGPVSASRGIDRLMLKEEQYLPGQRQDATIATSRNPDISEWEHTWQDCRTAISGDKAIKHDAIQRGWLELPEHVIWMRENGTVRQKKAAEKAALAYVMRASYPDDVCRTLDVIIGSVMRKPIEIEGVADGNDPQIGRLTEGDLDRADEKGRTFQQVGEYLLNEKGTTRYTAIYTMMTEGFDGMSRGKWKIYTAENIWDIDFDCGQLVYAVFREHEPLPTENRFERTQTQEIFRELTLERFGDTEQRRLIERIWEPVPDGEDGEYRVRSDQAIVVRDRNLTEIPVVIDGGPLPRKPMLVAMCQKTRELFEITADIKYRLKKIAQPIPHLNYTTPTGRIINGPREPKRESNAGQLKNTVATETKKAIPIMPGIMLQTQEAEFKRVYDTGEGLQHLKDERESCKRDLEGMGADYGLTTNNSNIAEGTERLRQGKDTAFVIAHIAGSSEALTQATRWLAVFNGVANDNTLTDINANFNLCLTDEGLSYTAQDVINFMREGALPRIVIIRLIRLLLPAAAINEDETDEVLLQMLMAEENAGVFGMGDVDAVGGDAMAEAIANGEQIITESLGQSLNGAQIASLVDVVEGVAGGDFPEDTGVEIIVRSFPGLGRADALAILTPLRTHEGPEALAAAAIAAS